VTEPQHAWRSTGYRQRVPGNFDRVPEYDPRSGDHLWAVFSMYRVNPQAEEPMLDVENLLTVQGPGCYFCEEPYTPRLSKRRCPGKPTHGR
jgi:hypothetical protein